MDLVPEPHLSLGTAGAPHLTELFSPSLSVLMKFFPGSGKNNGKFLPV